MEVRVNKGTSHPIEILSCGTSSCITIEEAERAMENIMQAINAAKRKPTEFEEALREMASEVMGYDFSDDGLRNCAAQLLHVARQQLRKEVPTWRKVVDMRTGLYKTATLDMRLNKEGYCLSLDELWEKLPKEE